MPIYGKKSEAREKLGREVEKRTRVVRSKGRRKYERPLSWGIENTSFRDIKVIFRKLFGEDDFISKRHEQTGKPVVVVDWGCGTGRATKELASQYGDRVRVYGLSQKSYREWNDIDNVKLIHAPGEDLPRYLKNGSVDLIYSHFGLMFFEGIHEYKPQGLNYLGKLLEKVSKGGKIAFNVPTAVLPVGLPQNKARKAFIKDLKDFFNGKATVESEKYLLQTTDPKTKRILNQMLGYSFYITKL